MNKLHIIGGYCDVAGSGQAGVSEGKCLWWMMRMSSRDHVNISSFHWTTLTPGDKFISPLCPIQILWSKYKSFSIFSTWVRKEFERRDLILPWNSIFDVPSLGNNGLLRGNPSEEPAESFWVRDIISFSWWQGLNTHNAGDCSHI